LSIAKWAVEVSGGKLTLERNDSGVGSIFRITLPETSPLTAQMAPRN
jgi:signal transduction histidine kinase